MNEQDRETRRTGAHTSAGGDRVPGSGIRPEEGEKDWYEKLIRYRNERNPFVRRLGIAVEELRPGYARVRKVVEAEDANPLGTAHGGVYFAVADSAAGSAACTHGRKCVTVDAAWHFFRAAVPGDVLTAEAEELKRGGTLSVYEVRIRGRDDTLLGSGTFTFYLLDEALEL